MTQPIESLECRRLFAAGAADPSFGDGGSISLKADLVDRTVTAKSRPTQLIVDAAGRTVVLSLSQGTANLTRLTADGFADTRFAIATGGIIKRPGVDDPDTATGLNSPHIAVDANNRIYYQTRNHITRYTSSGKIDRTFAFRGMLTFEDYIPMYGALDLAIDPGGGIYTIGRDLYDEPVGDTDVIIGRFTANGQPDGRFLGGVPGYNGYGRFEAPEPLDPDLGNEYSVGTDLRVLTDGSVMAVGSYYRVAKDSESSTKAEVGTLTFKFSGGKLDKSYGKNGRAAFRTVGNFIRSDPSTNFDLTFDVNADPVGIRSDGTVVMKVKTAGQPAYNFTLNAAGRYGAYFDSGSVITSAEFLRQGEDQELLLDKDRGTLIRLNEDDTRDSSFDSSRRIKNTTAATIANDGGVIFGDTGRDATDNKFSVRRVYGSEAPAGRLVPATLVGASNRFPFRVLWRDDDGVDLNTITGSELRVVSPDGTYVGVTLTGKTVSKGYVVADYRFSSADRTPFNASYNGTYQVRLRGGIVKDINGAAADVRTLGSLVIAIA